MKEKILAEIQKAGKIIIHRHVRPDPDAIGSQCGLAELIKHNLPEKQLYVVGESDISLQFLYTMDTIEDQTFEDALVIVCDTANQERISDQRYKLARSVIKIDHHPNDDQYGALQWVETTASSTSELIYELYLTSAALYDWKLNDLGAKLLYAGIVGDTGRFLFPSATQKTFDYAGELIRYDFDRNDLYNKLYDRDINLIKFQGYVLQHINLHQYGVASVTIDQTTLEKFEVNARDASQLVSSLGAIKQIQSWVFFVEEADQIRVRLRSKGPVINTIAKKYRGGGHPLASGATIYEWNEKEKVIADLEEVASVYLK